MESRYTWKNQLLNGLRNVAVIGGVVVLLAYLVIISNEAAQKELDTLFTEEDVTITIIDEPVVYGYENGAKIWELRSEIAETERETDSSQITRIYQLTLFKGGEENVLIRGDSGNWDKPRERLTLNGNVVVESADGTTLLKTEKLIWEERTKMLSCPEYVDFTVEQNHIIANSLYSADDLMTVDFIGDVEMFVVGLSGESFITREGEFPLADIEGDGQNDGMNVIAEYVHYDKSAKVCLCFPYVPLLVRSQHNLDETGRTAPEEPTRILDPVQLLTDPNYIEALQKSVAEMELTPMQQAFLSGEIDSLQTDKSGMTQEEPSIIPSPLGGSGASQDINDPELQMGERTSPVEGTGPAMGLPGSAENMMGPDISSLDVLGLNPGGLRGVGPVVELGGPPLSNSGIPRSDPNVVLRSPDYSRITGWQISPDLTRELFEGDPNFDPYSEARDGLVFCYRNNKKIWCEELKIDMNMHRIEAMRQADARFKDLSAEDREPAEGRAARAIQQTPTQLIGSYLILNWKENITEGYNRVLAIQPDKDIEADNVVYYENSDVVHAWGQVVVHQYSGQWWVRSGAIDDVTEERAREDIQNPTVMTTDALLIYNKRVSWGFGNVVFRQEKQTITSDRAQYEEDNEILVVAGNVNYSSEDGERLAAQLLTLDLYLDEYIAEGGAIARNKIPQEYRDDIDELNDDEDRKPEDDARTRLLENRTATGLGDWSEAIANPPPPPIEVYPEAQEHPTSLPPLDLGPEVPPPPIEGIEESFHLSAGDTDDVQTTIDPELLIPLMEETNTGH